MKKLILAALAPVTLAAMLPACGGPAKTNEGGEKAETEKAEGAEKPGDPNTAVLSAQQIADAGKTIAEGDYRDTEFCGACWDPLARTLFVNIQTPGITLAITGPWERGPL